MKIIDYKFVCQDDEDEKESSYETCYLFYINFDEEVETNCGDSYYDYSISFDNLIKLADYIKSMRNKRKG